MRESMKEERQTAWLVVDWGIRITVPILVLTISATAGILWNMNGRITAIESNRYTAQDARADREAFRDQVAGLRNYVEDNYPPPWLLEELRELKAEIKELRQELKDSRP